MKTILWDFDGVILDSMEVRDYGFKVIFKDFNKENVEELIKYHRINGGLSRYIKIRYFFECIIGRETSEEEIKEYATRFSEIMKEALVNPKNLIQDSLDFIKDNYKKYNFHIVSGSDQEELRFLCKSLEIAKYFLSIEGSPTPKKKLVKNLITKHKYDLKETCLIGDSINDYEATDSNNIKFYAYNNTYLEKQGFKYIEKLSYFNF